MEGKILEAYVTNLGKYNEGRLAGAPLNFPTTTEEVQALLKRIGVDGVRYEEIFITNFESDILGLYDHLGEYESIDELNHLAHLLSGMDDDELAKLEAVMDSGEYTGSVKDLINLTQNLDSYDFYPDVDSEEALGRLYIQELEAVQLFRCVHRGSGGHFQRVVFVPELLRQRPAVPALLCQSPLPWRGPLQGQYPYGPR